MPSSKEPLRIPKKKPDTIELNYIAQGPKYVKFHENWRKPYRILSGSFASGKTICAVYDLLFHLIYNPLYYGATALVVAVTGAHIKTQLIPVFEKIMTNYNERTKVNKGLVIGRHYELAKAPAYQIFFNKGINGGPTITFVSAESQQSIRAHSVDLVMVDDLGAQTLTEEVWNIIISRAFRNPRFDGDTRGVVIATCNPSSPSSWVYTRYMHLLQEGKPLPKELYLERLELFDNLSMKSQWETFSATYAHDSIGYSKNILGMWVGHENLIYPNYSVEKNVIETKHNVSHAFYDDDGKPYWTDAYLADSVINAGMDFGVNTACVWVATRTFNDGRPPIYIIFDEYFSNSIHTTIALHARHILNRGYRTNRYLTDHYVESRNSYNAAGIYCTPADKSKGAQEAGIDLIQRLLFEQRLFIHKKCVNFIREIGTYSYKAPDVPNDVNNHVMDASRYVLYAIAGQGSSANFTLPNTLKNVETPEVNIELPGPRIIVEPRKQEAPMVNLPNYVISIKNNLDGWQ